MVKMMTRANLLNGWSAIKCASELFLSLQIQTRQTHYLPMLNNFSFFHEPF